MADDEKALVNAWLADVARAAGDRENALLLLRSQRRALEELERMPQSYYQSRLEPTKARLLDSIAMFEERERIHAAKVPEFVALMEELPDSIVASALVYRVVKGMKWQQCAMRLYMSRQHLERLYKKSLPDLAKLVPDRYRKARDATKTAPLKRIWRL